MKHFLLPLLLLVGAVLAASCSGSSSASGAQAADSTAAPDPASQALASAPADSTLPMVIDFKAVWCGPCRQFAPVFHEVAARWQGRAVFRSIDVDSMPDIAAAFGVQSIPQVTILTPDGNAVSTTGYMTAEQLEAFLGQNIK